MASHLSPSFTLIVVTLTLTLTFTFTFASDRVSRIWTQSRVKDSKSGCVYRSNLYPPGSRFRPDPCTTCRCRKRSGVVHCVVKDCTTDQHCLKVSEDKNKRKKCCPKCLELGCRHSDGKIYKQGEVIRNEPCVRCYCPIGGGEPVCDVTSCPSTQCVDPVKVKGVCCPVCPNGPNCQIGLLTLPLNQTVEVEGANCTCEEFTDQDGKRRVLARCNKDLEISEDDEETSEDEEEISEDDEENSDDDDDDYVDDDDDDDGDDEDDAEDNDDDIDNDAEEDEDMD